MCFAQWSIILAWWNETQDCIPHYNEWQSTRSVLGHQKDTHNSPSQARPISSHNTDLIFPPSRCKTVAKLLSKPITRRSENYNTPQPLDQWTNSPFMGQQVGNWSICHALWAKRKPIVHPTFYAMNWCVSLWNGRDTMDVIFFFISRPGGLTRVKV